MVLTAGRILQEDLDATDHQTVVLHVPDDESAVDVPVDLDLLRSATPIWDGGRPGLVSEKVVPKLQVVDPTGECLGVKDCPWSPCKVGSVTHLWILLTQVGRVEGRRCSHSC